MNKKAYAYTTAAFFLSTIIVFTAVTQLQPDPVVTSTQQIRAMQDFVYQINNDLPRAAYISTTRGLLAIEDYLATEQQYLNTTDPIHDAVINGTVNNSVHPLTNNSAVQDYVARVQQIAQSRGLKLDLTTTNHSIQHNSPWTINYSFTMHVYFTNRRQDASWNYTQRPSVTVPITQFRDPLYSVSTQNRLTNTITNISTPLITTSNTTPLIEAINNSIYIHTTTAPSYLDRFFNTTAPHPQGIQSIVNKQLLSEQGIVKPEDISSVDYQYFNDITPSNATCNYEDVPEDLGFVIPSNQQTLYGVAGLNHSTTC